MYQLDLLGPVSLRRDGRPLALATHKVAALLVLLALGGPAHRSRVAQALWPDQDEPSARRNLRRELARLKEAGAADLLHSEGPVLHLARPPLLACDAWHFRDTLATSQPGATDAALLLWRGMPADGLALGGTEAFDDWLHAQREALGALRRQALLASAAAHEASGALALAVVRLETLLAEDPLQEHLHRELMRLHLAAGRREAALLQYRRCRELLQQELGLAPMAETTALAEAAAQRRPQQPATETAAEATGEPPARAAIATADALACAPTKRVALQTAAPWCDELPLTGRDAAWSAMQQAWDKHRVLLLEGEAGSGKTRLASDFAAAQGAYALAQCRAGDAQTPYAAFKRTLRLLAGPALADAGLPSWVTAELAHVLPELGPATPRNATAEDRSRLQEAALAAWSALAAGSFDSVVFDDWHLADADSRRLLAAIARMPAAPDAPRLLFLLRPVVDDDTRSALHTLAAAGALPLRLAPLDEAALLTLVRRLTGAPDAQRFSQRLLQATGGNPFYVAETLRHWQALGLLAVDEAGIWRTPFDDDTADYRELPLPASVRDAVLARVQRQPAAVRRLLEAAALAAEPFVPSLLARACALSELQALQAIEQALDDGLLRELGGGYAFGHDLVQMALDSQISPERRRLVHRRLALGADAADLERAEVARHWEQGGEPTRAVPHRLAAAERAVALGSLESAEQHWQAALAAPPTPAQHLALLRQRWPVLQLVEDRPALQVLLDELARLQAQWAQHPDSARAALEAQVEQALLLSLALNLHSSRSALELAESALPALAHDDPLRPRVQLAQAQALNNAARHGEAEQVVEAALASPAVPPRLQAQLLHTLAYSHFSRGQPQRALGFAQRTLLVWQAAGQRRLTARPLANIGLMHSAIGDQVRAAQALEQARALAAELRLVEIHREVCNNLADIRLTHGQPEQALALADEALTLSDGWTKPAFRVFLQGMKVQALWQLGRLGVALEAAETALQLALVDTRADTLVDCVSMSLDVYTFIGDHAGADRLLAAVDQRAGARSRHFEVKLAFNRVRLLLARGDTEGAAAALDSLGAVRDLHERRDQEQAVLCQAELALARGRAAQALRWLDDWPAPEAHVEVAARRALARLAAAVAQAGDAAAPAAAERAALADAAARAAARADLSHSPRPTVLELRRALAQAAAVLGAAEAQAAHRAQFDALLQRLADSLPQRPAAAQSLRATWR